MKKTLSFMLAIILAFTVLCSAVSCGDSHTHTFGTWEDHGAYQSRKCSECGYTERYYYEDGNNSKIVIEDELSKIIEKNVSSESSEKETSEARISNSTELFESFTDLLYAYWYSDSNTTAYKNIFFEKLKELPENLDGDWCDVFNNFKDNFDEMMKKISGIDKESSPYDDTVAEVCGLIVFANAETADDLFGNDSVFCKAIKMSGDLMSYYLGAMFNFGYSVNFDDEFDDSVVALSSMLENISAESKKSKIHDVIIYALTDYLVPLKNATNGLNYKQNDEDISYSVIGIGTCADESIIIPAIHDGVPVTGIVEFAFKDCTSLTSITIPDSVTSIGEGAFWYCTGLTSVTIGNGVTSIEWGAFTGCSGLTSITIPDSVTSIEKSAFSSCKSLTSITIPNSVTSIGESAFYYCTSLTSITIPDSVTSIGEKTFYKCSGLTSATIGNSVTSIGEYAFYCCTGLISVNIPDSVTSIGEYAFYECTSLTSITIPNSVTSIGKEAFYECSGLTSATIGNSVTSIENYAFYKCFGLTSVAIGNSVKSIGEYAFDCCTGLISVNIPDSVTSIGISAFAGCTGLTSIIIPDSVTCIEEKAFNNVANVVYNGTATGSRWGARSINGYVENGLIYKDSTKRILLACPSSITGKVTIPNSVTSIGKNAFLCCTGLTSVNIPYGVTSIGEYAFYECTSLTSIIIPNSVTSIGGSAFNNVANVIYNGTDTDSSWGARSINGYVENGLIYKDSNKKVLLACPSSITGKVTISNSVTSIEYHAFLNCTGLTSITIPDSVTSIGCYAFYGCTSLTSITIPDSVTNLEWNVFDNCESLTDIYCEATSQPSGWDYWWERNCSATVHWGYEENTEESKQYLLFKKCEDGYTVTGYEGTETDIVIPSVYNELPVTSIGNSAFSRCTGLTRVTIPDSVTSIGEDAFCNCESLTSITIPDSVTSIGEGAFSDCTSLTSITIPDSVTSIGDWAFFHVANVIYHGKATGTLWGARAINGYVENGLVYKDSNKKVLLACPSSIIGKVTIPDSVTSIGDDAFWYCTGLTIVTIPDNVTSIGEDAFSLCTSLTSITIPDSVTSIGKLAFYYCTGLTSVNIPDTVTSIGVSAFYGSGLTDIYCEAHEKSSNWSDLWLNGCSATVHWGYKGE